MLCICAIYGACACCVFTVPVSLMIAIGMDGFNNGLDNVVEVRARAIRYDLWMEPPHSKGMSLNIGCLAEQQWGKAAAFCDFPGATYLIGSLAMVRYRMLD